MPRYVKNIFLVLVLILWTAAAVYADEVISNHPNVNSSIKIDPVEDENLDLDDEFDEELDRRVFDPLSGYNRMMTHVNDKLYFWVLNPVAKGFAKVIPEPGRLAIHRCFKNVLFPVRLVNNLLQLKIKRAGIETARFGVNTTIGILGFRDPAKTWLELDAYSEDFGQTLGSYGVGSGFHIVLPLFGPTNARDAVGMIPDYFLNPINYIGNVRIETGVKAVDKFNYTSIHLGEYESIKKDAVDFYLFMRDAYEQNRKMKIEE